jgi:hypothetical protein
MRELFPEARVQSRASSRRDAQRSEAPLTGWLEVRQCHARSVSTRPVIRMTFSLLFFSDRNGWGYSKIANTYQTFHFLQNVHSIFII